MALAIGASLAGPQPGHALPQPVPPLAASSAEPSVPLGAMGLAATARPYWTGTDTYTSRSRFVGGDVNGDGFGDVIQFAKATATGSRVYFYKEKASSMAKSLAWRGFMPFAKTQVASGDYNGDRKTDLYLLRDRGRGVCTVYVMISNGAVLRAPKRLYTSAKRRLYFARARLTASDPDRDHRDEAVILHDRGSLRPSMLIVGRAHTKVRSMSARRGALAARSKVAGGDVNGDGLGDVIQFYRRTATGSTAFFNKSRRTNMVSYTAWAGSMAFAKAQVASGDYNGDRKTDLYVLYDRGYGASSVFVMMSDGAKLATPKELYRSARGGMWFARARLIAADPDKDGSREAVIVYESGAGRASMLVLDAPNPAPADPGDGTASPAPADPGSGTANPAPADPGGGTPSHSATVGAQVGQDEIKACADCHSMDLPTEHAKPSSSGSRSCATCHPSPRANLVGSWDGTCGACHGATASGGASMAPSRHVALAAGHSLAGSAECVTCHSASLPVIHKNATTRIDGTAVDSCLVCHREVGAPASLAGKTCTTCHSVRVGDHYDAADHSNFWTLPSTCQGSECHAAGAQDLMAVHTRLQSSFGCMDCHASPSAAVIAAIGAGNGACDACHPGVSLTTGHLPPHSVDPPLMSAPPSSLPAYSYYTGSHGASPTVECAGCHVSDLVEEHLGVADASATPRPSRTDSAGVALTCATCHAQPLGTRVYDAINTTHSTACDSCHVVHGPPMAIHASTFVTAPPLPCADCHGNGDLLGIHLQLGQVTTPSGKVLIGCEICHGNFEAPMGAPTQAAIDSGDTLCTACHFQATRDVAAEHPAALDKHTAPAAPNCSACHATGDVRPIHASRAEGSCAVCHANPSSTRIGDITTKTAACVSCHASLDAAVTAHAAYAPAHTSTQTSCAGTGCHAIGSLTTLHSAATTTIAGVAYSGCTVCHRSPTQQPTSSDCVACHPGHEDVTAVHTAPAAPNCSACHATGDVRPIHASRAEGSCAVCHANPSPTRIGDITTKTAACVSCHASLDATVTAHAAYAPAHTSTQTSCAGTGCHAIGSLTTLHSAATTTIAGVAYSGCTVCHRSPTQQPTSSDCVACHPGHADVTAVHTAPAAPNCSACHATGDVRPIHASRAEGACAVCHANPSPTRIGDITTKTAACVSCHASLDVTVTAHAAYAPAHTSAQTSCAGTGCHAIGNLNALHSAATTTVAGVAYSGCTVCHRSPTQQPASSDCTVCHVAGGHVAQHDTAAVVDAGCFGCHFASLDDEHLKQGYACATCHTSTNSAVSTAIANHNRACQACHPAVNGRDYHAAQNSTEYIAGNVSLHRVNSSLPSARTSFVVNGTTYTWSLPAASTWLKTGWTTTSVVTCDNCHSFGGAATGPHGASVLVNIDPAYAADWNTATLGSGSSFPATLICTKCHLGASNSVHSKSDHSGRKCTTCHTGVPHGWRIPRMLAYTTDPAPYAAATGGLTAISLKSRTPTNWQEADCKAGCAGNHSGAIAATWPSTAP